MYDRLHGRHCTAKPGATILQVKLSSSLALSLSLAHMRPALLQADGPYFLVAGSLEETLEPALVLVAERQKGSTLGRVHVPVSQRSLSLALFLSLSLQDEGKYLGLEPSAKL